MSEYYITGSPDYLEHHGILGMKWGVRRYQNKDGSLTPEGRARYGDVLTKKQMQNYIREYNLRTGSNKTINKNTVFKTANGIYDYKGRKLRNADVEVENPTEEKKTKSESNPKEKNRMTDEELRAANLRMAMEEEYLRHVNNLNPKKVTVGQQFISNLKSDLVKDIPAGISGMIRNAISSAGNSKPDSGSTSSKKTDLTKDVTKATDQELKDMVARQQNIAKLAQYQKDILSAAKDVNVKDIDPSSFTDEEWEELLKRRNA